MGSGFWGLGMQSVMQREQGSLRRYRLAPIGPGTILLSNLLANYLLELPTISLLLVSALVFFHMPMKIGWLTLLALVTVGTFAFAGFGLTIASVANTMQEAQIYNNLVWVTLVFLSGVTFPLPMLPLWVQRLAMFFPSTYLVSAFQGVMSQADSFFDHWPEMLVLIVSGVFRPAFRPETLPVGKRREDFSASQAMVRRVCAAFPGDGPMDEHAGQSHGHVGPLL